MEGEFLLPLYLYRFIRLDFVTFNLVVVLDYTIIILGGSFMTAILWLLGGATVGACVALVLYILGFGAELINCACQIITCNCDGGDAIPGMWSGDSFIQVLIFCVIGGAIIGLIYGIYKMKTAADEESARRNAENSEEARKERVKWADEVKQKALDINNTCEKNKALNSNLVSTTYQASSQMKDIVNELTKTAELQGKVNSIVDELARKGGSQL